ncbi:MAG: LysM peptidoglycan-binding domain-containing protein [Anaerolineaceae bacterium]
MMTLQACYQPINNYDPWRLPEGSTNAPTHTLAATASQALSTQVPRLTLTPAPAGPIPTPNQPAILPTLRSETTEYAVQSGDSLARIALKHQVSVAQILAANENVEDPNLIEPDQKLIIPPASANELATYFKIIPDSELLYSPSAIGFDTESVVYQFNGKLATYTEELEDGSMLTGAEIVQRVADEFSVNPRLLLAVLEYRSGWLTGQPAPESSKDYPLGLVDEDRKGLYKQLSWAANEMTRGYTLWEQRALAVWTLADGAVMRIDPTINGGTAGMQYMLGLLLGKDEWKQAVSSSGFYTAYQSLFGFPFAFAIEPLVPADLTQPDLALPLAEGDTWYLTGGPHVGWGTGSAWAGLDFAPPGEEYGCYESTTPVLAAADGLVVRSENGAVVQDLDGDGIEQTGWSLLYMHIAAAGRTSLGTYLNEGDVIGYPSCEGGFSTGTHLHVARRYNGAWIPADGGTPFVLGGWVASGTGVEYDGYLSKDGQTVEAFNGRADFNQIGR